MDETSEFEFGRQQLDDCKYLFANSIREIEELTLELIVSEARTQEPILVARNDSFYEQLLVGGRRIETDDSCRSFRLVFDRHRMISYTVLNESYGRYPEPPEMFEGKLFRIFSWSHLLEFTRRTTYASDEYPGPLFHYQLACLNHVFDVIATGPPTIDIVAGDDVTSAVARVN